VKDARLRLGDARKLEATDLTISAYVEVHLHPGGGPLVGEELLQPRERFPRSHALRVFEEGSQAAPRPLEGRSEIREDDLEPSQDLDAVLVVVDDAAVGGSYEHLEEATERGVGALDRDAHLGSFGELRQDRPPIAGDLRIARGVADEARQVRPTRLVGLAIDDDGEGLAHEGVDEEIARELCWIEARLGELHGAEGLGEELLPVPNGEGERDRLLHATSVESKPRRGMKEVRMTHQEEL
jgi:hypothetical protein